MARSSQALLEPRKLPMQARSAASVEATLEATLQVLLAVGKERLTTTRVAARAGVSVGTLYQYFPNKSALLKAALRRHLNEVAKVVEVVCSQHQGGSAGEMVTALVKAFLGAKMKNVKISVALHWVSADVDGARIAQGVGLRLTRSIAAMLETAHPPLTRDPLLVASMLQGAMAGVSRKLIESPAPENKLEPVQQELIFLACTYMGASSEEPGASPAPKG